MFLALFIYASLLFLVATVGQEPSLKYDAFAYFFNIQRRPTMYVYTVDSYPVLLFADAFLGGSCVTWTSRYRSDGRPNYEFSQLSVRFQLNGIDQMLFDPPYKVWDSNAEGKDTPVRQIQFCNPLMEKVKSVVMFVQYADEPARQFTLLRFSLPKVDAAACTMSSLKDLWSARAWVEHHRNLGIDRFNIYINSVIPSPVDKSLTAEIGAVLGFLLYQKDVVLIEWPFDFKDPNTTRDKITQPLHYARPLEWNSCNEREHYGASVVLFNDMDEFLVSKFPILKVVRSFPDTCRGVHVGQYWTKVMCQATRSVGMGLEQDLGTDLDATRPAFDSLNTLRNCKMMRHPDLLIDPKRRAKMLLRTERDDIHDVFNHDLSIPLAEECKAQADNAIAYQYHIINLRPNHEHASAAKFLSIKKMIKAATSTVDVEQDFYPYRRDDNGLLTKYELLVKERSKGSLSKALVVKSEAKLTNKNEIVFESFPAKREMKQLRKEFKQMKREKTQQKQIFEKEQEIQKINSLIAEESTGSAVLDGFDELDRFYQNKLAGNKKKKDNKQKSDTAGVNSKDKMRQKSKHLSDKKSSKRGFDFEKEFLETGELKSPLTKENSHGSILHKSNKIPNDLSVEKLPPTKVIKMVLDVDTGLLDAEQLQKQYNEMRRKKRGKTENSRSSQYCPFPFTLPQQTPRAVKTKEGVDIFPFQYAFQQQRMPHELRQAVYDWSIIWPVQSKSRLDKKRGYIFEDEESYYKEYGTSIFAYTYRKGGWESMRHYEILCNGAIPYFIDIDKMPPYTMTRFPKDIIKNVMALPGINPVAGSFDHQKIDVQCLHDVRKTLLEYCHQNLTTKALAKYFLSAMGKPHAKNVLMINARHQWEYLTDSLLHGLRVLLGSGFVDYKQRLHMYKGLRERAIQEGFKEYGKGFSYAYALPDDKNIERDTETVRMQIKKKHFDIIIIGQLFQPKNLHISRDWETSLNISEHLFWPEISTYYSRSEVALLDGLDYHKPEQRDYLIKVAKYGTLFVREIDRHVLKGIDTAKSWIPGSENAKRIWDEKMQLELSLGKKNDKN